MQDSDFKQQVISFMQDLKGSSGLLNFAGLKTKSFLFEGNDFVSALEGALAQINTKRAVFHSLVITSMYPPTSVLPASTEFQGGFTSELDAKTDMMSFIASLVAGSPVGINSAFVSVDPSDNTKFSFVVSYVVYDSSLSINLSSTLLNQATIFYRVI